MKKNTLIAYFKPIRFFTLLIITLVASYSCQTQVNNENTEKASTSRPVSQVNHPEWSRNAVIYEVNVRQFSQDGSLNAVADQLPELKKLGVDILWLMPIYPIGEKNRKGPLGSYYSVKNYKEVNPEFGTMDDFKALVKKTHEEGLHIILDWVPNHSAWDNPLTVTHPDYYMKDSVGNFVSPFDWTDVIRFNYDNPDMRHYMTNTMKWWITETGIDGFRCDVAHMIPENYWNNLRASLDSLPGEVFMLAESDQPFLNDSAFDMTYDWKFHHIMNEIASGNKEATAVMQHFNWVDSVYPVDSYLMEFTSNHDENSWNGSAIKRLGLGAPTFAALTYIVPGMPLIYDGQEAGMEKSLLFFERDPIVWKHSPMRDLYTELNTLKHTSKALYNGAEGGSFVQVNTSADANVFAALREKDADRVFAVFNLSDSAMTISLKGDAFAGDFQDYFDKTKTTFVGNDQMLLSPWEYKIYTGNN